MTSRKAITSSLRPSFAATKATAHPEGRGRGAHSGWRRSCRFSQSVRRRKCGKLLAATVRVSTVHDAAIFASPLGCRPQRAPAALPPPDSPPHTCAPIGDPATAGPRAVVSGDRTGTGNLRPSCPPELESDLVRAEPTRKLGGLKSET